MRLARLRFDLRPLLAVLVLPIAGCGQNGSPKLTVPVVTTAEVAGITPTVAHPGGTHQSGAEVTALGICWSSTNPTPTLADNVTVLGPPVHEFFTPLTGLTPGTTYYARAYGTNSAGTGYGSVQPFTMVASDGTVTDIDGNVYQTVTIGSQVWTAENLGVTHYRDGSPILTAANDADWGSSTEGRYSSYEYDQSLVAVYGRLYNWYAVNDGRNLAPPGWHVPTEADWQTLEMQLGMDPAEVAKLGWRGIHGEGGKLKTFGVNPWWSPNTGATNSSRFSALPGGWRVVTDGRYSDVRWSAMYWSSTESNATDAWFRSLDCTLSTIRRNFIHKGEGFSVRLVKD